MGLKAAILAVALAAPAGAGGLDGSRWKLRENGFLSKILFWKYDHLSFSGGAFDSADCRLKGFAPAAYQASEANGALHWTATMAGPKGKMVWDGRRRGDRMDGVRTWIRPDGKTRAVFWTSKQSSPK